MRTKKNICKFLSLRLVLKKRNGIEVKICRLKKKRFLRHEVDSPISKVINRIDYEICVIFCRYTRNLVDAGNGKFNLMVLCWNTSQGSAIHDHANAHCFMKVLDGHSQEELFEWPPGSEDDGEMKSKGKKLYERDQVAYISGEFRKFWWSVWNNGCIY